MSITRNFKLFLNAGRTGPLVIHANQYDFGEQWVFSLFTDAGIPYTPTTGAIVGIKSDNLGIINTGTVVDGKVVINETQQMTAAPGRAIFELMIDDSTHGTANFIVLVEPKPGNNADLSESDLSLIQEAINSTNPQAIAQGVSDWMDENLTPTTPVVDASLTVQGAAADAKATGDAIAAISQGSGLTADIKQALMDFANAVAFKGNDPLGQTYIDALEDALYPPADLSSISAVYTQSGTVYETDSLDSLKSDLVVTAHYDDSTTETVTTYTLSGTLTEGTSTITVSYGGKTTTFTVTVSETFKIVFQSGYTRSNVSGKLETNASRSTSNIIPNDDTAVTHAVSCTVNGTTTNIALRAYDENGINYNSNGFATSQTVPVGNIKAYAVILQTSLTSETVVLTIDGNSYNAELGTVSEYTNTVPVNISIQGIDATTGEPVANTARLLTDYIYVTSSIPTNTGIVYLSLTANAGIYLKVFEYDNNGILSDTLGGLNTNTATGNLRNGCTRIRVLFKKSDNSDITSADIESLTLNNYGIVDYEFTEV